MYISSEDQNDTITSPPTLEANTCKTFGTPCILESVSTHGSCPTWKNNHVKPHANYLMIGILPPIVLPASAKDLNLYGNQIGDTGAEKLAQALPHLTNLKAAWLGSPSWLCVDHQRARCAMRAWLLFLDSHQDVLNVAIFSELVQVGFNHEPLSHNVLREISRFYIKRVLFEIGCAPHSRLPCV